MDRTLRIYQNFAQVLQWFPYVCNDNKWYYFWYKFHEVQKKIITSKDANDKKKKVYFDKEKLNVYFLPMIVTWMQEPKGSCD